MAAGAHAMHGAHGSHAQMVAEHADHVDHDAHSPASNGGHDHSAACSCLGSCCCCAPVSGPIANVAFIDVEIVASHPLAYAEVPPPNFARTYAQPYPNGPPARA
ncbi:MAG TPA: hypothetical protein VGM50_04450 [Gemmatimonadaceae bacterium]